LPTLRRRYRRQEANHLGLVERPIGDALGAPPRSGFAGSWNRFVAAGRAPLRLAMYSYLRTVRSWPLLLGFPLLGDFLPFRLPCV
jgi:hypothetical protein